MKKTLEEKIRDMESRINWMVKDAESHKDEWDEMQRIRLARIDGAIGMLNIVTGKLHYIDAEGIHEIQ